MYFSPDTPGPLQENSAKTKNLNAIGFFIARHNKGQIVGFNKAR